MTDATTNTVAVIILSIAVLLTCFSVLAIHYTLWTLFTQIKSMEKTLQQLERKWSRTLEHDTDAPSREDKAYFMLRSDKGVAWREKVSTLDEVRIDPV